MRDIKFKFFCKESYTFSRAFTLKELIDGLYDFHSDSHNVIKLQYTGLKDKNGVEIYEGDIVSIIDCEPSLYKICYWKDNFKWGVEYIGTDLTNWQDENLEEFSGEDFEVIGNIYENPELLELKNE